VLGQLRQTFSSPRAGLFKANPWLEAHAEDVTRALALPGSAPGPAIAAARRDAALARLRAGPTAWNGWATRMHALAAPLGTDPAAQRLWAYAAATDLSGLALPGDVAGLLFPGTLDMTGAVFGEAAWFSASICAADVRLDNAHFSHGAYFERVVFNAAASFAGAVFGRAAEFRQAQFRGPASFRAARFEKDAWFRGSSFETALDMSEASFGGEAGFGDIRYRGPADFSRAVFRDNAGFEAAVFEDVARFDDARFERNARFEQAAFGREPSFDRARFLGKILFEGVGVPEGQSAVHRTLADLARRLG
jgi:hypothetical protein